MKIERRSFLKLIPAVSGISLFPEMNTQPKSKIALRVLIASDGHYGQEDTNFVGAHTDLTGWINRERFQKGVDFVIFNGDVIHNDPTLLYDFKKAISNLSMPYYVVRGNHDRVGLDVWESTWGYSTNHSFVHGQNAFLLVDTSNEAGKYLCPDITWLKQQLEKYAHLKRVFIFMHITPEKWTAHGVECKEVTDLFAKTPNVKAIFHGHDHDQDGYKMMGNKPYFFDGHFGGNWGTTYKGYRVLEVYEDQTWQSYQYNPTAAPVLNSFTGKV